MTFQQLYNLCNNVTLNEKVNYETPRRSVSISEDETIKLFRQNCSKYDPIYGHHLFRGVRDATAPYVYIDPTKSTRRSANTRSYTMWLIEDSDKWKDYPQRSKSIICSTTDKYASIYSGRYDEGGGKLYHVIPYDTAKIGMANTVDFFQSFKTSGLDSVPDLNYLIQNMLDFNQDTRNVIPDSPDAFFKRLSTVSHALQNDPTLRSRFIAAHITDLDKWSFSHELQATLVKSILEGYSFMDILQNILDPDVNGFELYTMDNFRYDEDINKEVWTDGPALMVDVYHYDDFIKAIK